MAEEMNSHYQITKELDGIYRFIAESYQGNWQFRFQSTPYMQEAVKAGKQESIHGHVWACMEFWYLLKQICPNLALVMNSERLYEILLNHDLGEVYNGDSAAFQQIQNAEYRIDSERESLMRLISYLPDKERTLILSIFDNFEDDVHGNKNLEYLMAKFIDHILGNHVVLTLGRNLENYLDPIEKIVKKRFVSSTSQLAQRLKDENHQEALRELKKIAEYHANIFCELGIAIDLRDNWSN